MNSWDRVGVIASSLCIVHCFILPLIFILAPYLVESSNGEEPLLEEIVHFAFLFAVTLIAIVAFYRGYKMHHNLGPTRYFFCGLAIVFLVLIFEPYFPNIYLPHAINIVGSLLLIRAHILNHACKKCSHPA